MYHHYKYYETLVMTLYDCETEMFHLRILNYGIIYHEYENLRYDGHDMVNDIRIKRCENERRKVNTVNTIADIIADTTVGIGSFINNWLKCFEWYYEVLV